MEVAESGGLGEVAESGLGEANTEVLLIEDGVVVVEEGKAQDPEGARVGDVHVHDLEEAETAVALNVVLASHRVVVPVNGDSEVWVRAILRVGALAHEQVPQRGVHPAGVVALEELSERPEVAY